MLEKSLHAKNSALSKTEKQLEILSNGIFQNGSLPTFAQKIKTVNQFPLRPKKIEILQINVGYMCNQVCALCHVDAGPDRKEIMTIETMQQILEVLKTTQVNTLDLTGGAPEMNPNFRWFVEQATKLGVKDFIVRSNLTIILANKKYHDLPGFFAKHNIHVISSLPFYKREKTDKQRGDGVFDKSIKALQMLNEVGYGKENSTLNLDLVYNPSGAFLPSDQMALQNDFKKALKECIDLADELKVIIAHENDFRFAQKYAQLVNINCKLFLQPEWSLSEDLMPEIISYVKENPHFRISLQVHKYLNIP